MITDLFDKFSNGTIEIKFQIVTPLTSRQKRNTVLAIGFVLTAIYTFYVIPKSLDKLHLTGLLPMAIGLLSGWLLYDLLTKKWLLQIKTIGLVKFLSDTVEIKLNDNSFEEAFKYSDIKGIRYQYSVPSEVVFTKTPPAKTYIIEFVLYDKPPIVIEIENKMYLTTDDLKQKWNIEPTIKTVFTYLTPKYGIENVDKITTPNIGLP